MATSRSRSGARRTAVGLVVAAVVLVAVIAVVAWQFGPRVGLRVEAPSPQEYAEDALARMDEGYYASGQEWESEKERVRAQAREASSYEQVWPALEEAVGVAGGSESTFEPAGTRPEGTRTPDPMPTVRQDGPVAVHTLPPVTADAPPYSQQYADQLGSNLDATRAQATCGTVIDLRETTGGDMYPLLAGLTPVLPDGDVAGFTDRFGQVTVLGVEGGTVTRDGDYTFATYENHPKLSGPVAVLQGPHTAGAGEVAQLALSGAAGARTFGEPTAGHGVVITEHRLHDGARLRLTTALVTDAAGTVRDGSHAPDAAVATTDAEAAATGWLREQCGR